MQLEFCFAGWVLPSLSLFLSNALTLSVLSLAKQPLTVLS